MRLVLSPMIIYAIAVGLPHRTARAFVGVSRNVAARSLSSSVLVSADSGSRSRLSRPGSLASSSVSSPPTVDTNPLMDQSGLPKFSSIDPSHLEPAIESILSDIESKFSEFESSAASASGYDDVLPEVEKIQYPLGYVWGVAGHLNGVKNSPELRKAYEAAQPRVVQTSTKFSQSAALYAALEKLSKEGSSDDADDFAAMQRQRAVEGSLRSMRNSGVGLEGEQKERFNEIRMRMAELTTTFSNNVLDATKEFGLDVTDGDVLEGTPETARAMWATMAAQKINEEKGEDEEKVVPDPVNGPWRITLDGPSYMSTMQHVKDRGVREQIYKAYLTRASDFSSEDKMNNIPLIDEILTLRAEASKILGYSNYAEQSLDGKMAPSVDSVTELSDLVLERALPAARRELQEVTDHAKAFGGEVYASLDKLEPWDITFWSERLREQKFDVTEEELRPYFALPAVLEGLFGLAGRLFDIDIEAAEGQAEVWNEDVSFFHVKDRSTGKHVASFYLDPYSRPADKRGGAWMDVCLGKSKAMGCDVPVAYLTCNGSPPSDGKPSLMTFREVETLFHEAGHGLQHMLTEASEGDVAGINGVEWDAVELPSQFMENWCYDRPTVYGFAKHYETGEPLPEELFEKLRAQRTFNAGMMSCRQLYFGQLDMELHSNYDPASSESIFDVQKRVAAKYVPHTPPLESDRFLCTFGHIFAGGYAAGYYSYKWAEVMSADAFGAFEDVGLENEDAVQEVGRRFRKTVLALGGGVEPMEVYRRFRGREPTPDALLRHNGLV